jgi:hypothetical protein
MSVAAKATLGIGKAAKRFEAGLARLCNTSKRARAMHVSIRVFFIDPNVASYIHNRDYM